MLASSVSFQGEASPSEAAVTYGAKWHSAGCNVPRGWARTHLSVPGRVHLWSPAVCLRTHGAFGVRSWFGAAGHQR